MLLSKCQVYERSLARARGIGVARCGSSPADQGWHAEPRVRARIVTGKYSSFAGRGAA